MACKLGFFLCWSGLETIFNLVWGPGGLASLPFATYFVNRLELTFGWVVYYCSSYDQLTNQIRVQVGWNAHSFEVKSVLILSRCFGCRIGQLRFRVVLVYIISQVLL